ncbi:MAG: hypothetical protein NT118_15610 [Lentisphaerae bacterium]|nr:hypothetical protein [Lentisphaerota bacterium]
MDLLRNAKPSTLNTGDWCEQGFPCYSGSIRYSIGIEINPAPRKRSVLEIPAWKAALVKVHVNGKKAGNIAWKPYGIDITDFVVKGRNEIEIEIVGTRRNLLGPLHLNEKYPNWTGPWQFKQPENWTGEYVRFHYGLLGKPSISVRA